MENTVRFCKKSFSYDKTVSHRPVKFTLTVTWYTFQEYYIVLVGGPRCKVSEFRTQSLGTQDVWE